jgi:hypothetical protein
MRAGLTEFGKRRQKAGGAPSAQASRPPAADPAEEGGGAMKIEIVITNEK